MNGKLSLREKRTSSSTVKKTKQNTRYMSFRGKWDHRAGNLSGTLSLLFHRKSSKRKRLTIEMKINQDVIRDVGNFFKGPNQAK